MGDLVTLVLIVVGIVVFKLAAEALGDAFWS